MTIKYTSTLPGKSKQILNELVTFIENKHLNLQNNKTKRITSQLTFKIQSLDNQIEFINNSILSQIEDEKLRITNEIENLNNILPSNNSKIKLLNKVALEDQSNLQLLESNPGVLLQRTSQSPTLNQVIHSYKDQVLDLYAENINTSQKIDNLKIQLKLLDNNNLDSEETFKLLQEKDSLKIQLKLLDNNNLDSEETFKLLQEKDSLELELEFLMQQNISKTLLIGEIETEEVNSKKRLIIFSSFIFGLFLSIVMVFINYSLKAFKEEQV